MSTAVVPYGELERMAAAFASSGMFGAKTKEQAMSLLLLAQAEGVHPAIAMRDFDIIQGKPAKKAEAMQRAFLAAGGKIEWHKYDDDGAEATFSHPHGGTIRLGWDIARAKKAGLSSKDMYGKYARQMFGSRTISEGVRKVYPAATSGLYVPEEVRSFSPASPAAERDMGVAQVVDEDVTLKIPGCGPETVSAPPQDSPPKPPRPAGDAGFISDDQVATLRKRFTDCDKLAEEQFLKIAKIEKLELLPAPDYDEAIYWIDKRKARFQKQGA